MGYCPINFCVTMISMNMETAAARSANQEEEIKNAEKALETTGIPENPEELVDFDGQLKDITAKEDIANGKLNEKLLAYQDWKDKLNSVRESLGLEPVDEPYPGQSSIDEIRNEIERLKEEEKVAEDGKDMNDILEMLSALSPTEINIIIATGKTSDGKEIRGKGDKKIKPSILKRLLAFAYQGAKALTIAGFKKFMEGMEGIANGIYESEKK